MSINKIVFICSPYAGDVEANTRRARRFCRFACDQEFVPIAPHLLFPQFLNDDDPHERDLCLSFGNALMSKCDEIWVFGQTISTGMKAEIEQARRKNLLFRYFAETCEEVPHA